MIGGASQIPQARHALGELLGHDRIVDSGPCRPMTAVARGAAICAASLDGELGDDRDFSLGTSYDLGTAVSAGEREGFGAIIRRNATLPAEGSADFYPHAPGALFVRVPVIEGEVGYSADSDRAFPLPNAELAGTRPVPIDTSVRVVEVHPAVTGNGELRGVVTRPFRTISRLGGTH
ncbi:MULTISPECIES: Hsp70 family protein [unclassified Streptomyces]|uniref:Hsp70 family protein n=1 Tax=unclassified Streptomyces TaxID=2593676 RepID=UPI000B504701|nr:MULTISPECIES: Hsp70 family protein [unclassified Streptomyces]MYX01723.1 Hsp70 family protein [Streptomyces sp. SID8378]SNB80200.1 Molecular chaperone [Streptomyces sp. PgraA7]